MTKERKITIKDAGKPNNNYLNHKITIKYSDNVMELQLMDYNLVPSKHFSLGWMRKWGWNMDELELALKGSSKIKKVGKCKFEAYATHGCKGKSRKLIFITDNKEVLVITGAEGKW